MRSPQQAQYERDYTALKHYLIGRDYTEALRALGIAVRWHVGFRKDKVTPQLHHQVWVCFNFLNAPIKGLTPVLEQRALSALLCHDTVEDHPVTFADLRKKRLSKLTVELVKGLTKVEGETDEQFFERLLSHWLLPILKACDRDNNVMTMQGAFAIPKMKAYILETRKYILVLLKKAGNLYPEHHRAYSALAAGIKKQLRIYEGFIASAEAADLINGNLQDQLDQMTGFSKRQTETLAGIDKQVTALISVNEQLRAELQTARLQLQLLSGHAPPSLMAANVHAQDIADLGKTIDLTGTVFRSA
jgi:hypothetical protein